MTAATHRAFNLGWSIPFDFPQFTPAPAGQVADVIVEPGDVPFPPPNATWAGPLRAVEPDAITIGGLPFGRMRIHSGRSIVVDRTDDDALDALQVVLMGIGASLICHQRGILPLHGSGVLTEHGAIAIVGASGAGKSSLLAEFVAAGGVPLCDDLTAVPFPNDAPHVAPGTRVMKMWPDAIESLGGSIDGLVPVRAGLPKYFVPLFNQPLDPVPLVAVYRLDTHREPETTLTRLAGAAAFHVLLEHTWGKMTIRRMGLQQQHFHQISRLASAVPVLDVRRPLGAPREGAALSELVLDDLSGRT